MEELRNARNSTIFICVVWIIFAVIGVFVIGINLVHLAILYIGAYCLMAVPVNKRFHDAVREIEK